MRKTEMAGIRTRANQGIGLMVGMLVVGLLAAILLPIILGEFADVETDAEGAEWEGTWETLFDLIPIFIILGAALYFVFTALDGSKGRGNGGGGS